jgi:hypothetical protein
VPAGTKNENTLEKAEAGGTSVVQPPFYWLLVSAIIRNGWNSGKKKGVSGEFPMSPIFWRF